MDQSQEILLGHAIFASNEYGYHGYRRIARSISNKLIFKWKNVLLVENSYINFAFKYFLNTVMHVWMWERVVVADLSHDEDVEDEDDDKRNDGVDERINPRPEVLNTVTNSLLTVLTRHWHFNRYAGASVRVITRSPPHSVHSTASSFLLKSNHSIYAVVLSTS